MRRRLISCKRTDARTYVVVRKEAAGDVATYGNRLTITFFWYDGVRSQDLVS